MTARNKQIGAATQPSPQELIAMVRHSIRCFGFGLASATPLLALPVAAILAANGDRAFRIGALVFAVLISLISLLLSLLAARNRQQARRLARGHWNPAKSQLLWGEIFSSLGVLLSLLTFVFLAAVLMGLVPIGQDAQ